MFQWIRELGTVFLDIDGHGPKQSTDTEFAVDTSQHNGFWVGWDNLGVEGVQLRVPLLCCIL